ncbi:hypothetical protein DESUT3_37630 [Desulfuromonas versatilis]|uniref:Glycosyl transferase family 1 domain-containing protein n=2 Tax=Desulfuromonas versatilis TaxID=2802975 RepID=A0ABN6E5Y0_9BACT|nr:hypothetical protein DESUT3_37630 [Desulfuromonas versatilis]
MLRCSSEDFDFDIIGHFESKDTQIFVDDYLSTHSLNNKIKLSGRLDGNSKFVKLSKSDVYIFPSWTEGCPTSVLEALTTGLFVIATNVGALPEIIKENENGRLIPAKDSFSLFENMKWSIQNIQYIRQQKEQIKYRAINSFRAEVICNDFSQIYSKLF